MAYHIVRLHAKLLYCKAGARAAEKSLIVVVKALVISEKDLE